MIRIHLFFVYSEVWNVNVTSFGRVESVFKNDMPRLKDKSIIGDLGCSIGATTIELASKYKNSTILGIDINEEILPKNTLKQSDLVNKIIETRKSEIKIELDSRCSSLNRNKLKEEIDKLEELYNSQELSKIFFKCADIFELNNLYKIKFDALFMMNNYLFMLDNISYDRHQKIKDNLCDSLTSGGYILMSGSNKNKDSDKIIFQKKGEDLKCIYCSGYDFFSNNKGFYDAYLKSI